MFSDNAGVATGDLLLQMDSILLLVMGLECTHLQSDCLFQMTFSILIHPVELCQNGKGEDAR
jgi:hypothetical protein